MNIKNEYIAWRDVHVLCVYTPTHNLTCIHCIICGLMKMHLYNTHTIWTYVHVPNIYANFAFDAVRDDSSTLCGILHVYINVQM